MMIIIQGKARKDDKHKVSYRYQGAANAFGGHYPIKIFNKLQTAETIRQAIAKKLPDDVVEGESFLGASQYLTERG